MSNDTWSPKCDFNISFDLNDSFNEIEESIQCNESFHDDEAFKVSFNISFDNDLEPIRAKTKTGYALDTVTPSRGIS